jgi:UDP-N-acetylmuramoyl-L-alanyl-D-glutamate--2,6-diaminopimelate ligase
MRRSAGGDRAQRALMGQVAQAYADEIILTSDNPRSEDPKRIIDDILAGMTTSAAVTVQVDREQAIYLALEKADANDLILIAGKGHETYQEIGHQRHEFSDQNVIRAAAQCTN